MREKATQVERFDLQIWSLLALWASEFQNYYSVRIFLPDEFRSHHHLSEWLGVFLKVLIVALLQQ